MPSSIFASRGLHVLERLLELSGQRLSLTSLGGNLRRVGEVGVVGQRAVLAKADLLQLAQQGPALFFEEHAVVDTSIFVRHGATLVPPGRGAA